MKAYYHTSYGPVDSLQLIETDIPEIGDEDVLVEVHGSSINYANVALVTGKPWMARLTSGIFKPKYNIQGGDFAGLVTRVGIKVTKFKEGDEVYGDTSDIGFAAFAEYVKIPEKYLAHKPVNLTMTEAASVPQASVVALQGLREYGNIKAGQKVMIVGASGGIGTFAIQLAKHFGAEVTAVCSTRNIDLMESLNADHIIDYTKKEISDEGPIYDMVLTIAGYKPIQEYLACLKPGGIYVVAGGSMKQILEPMYKGLFIPKKGRKVKNLLHKINDQDLISIKELIEAEKVKPVIEKTYPFEKIPDALKHYGKGKTRGKIAISFK